MAVNRVLSQQVKKRMKVDLLKTAEVRISLGNGREPSLLELVDGWTGHVLRLYLERETTLTASPSAWGVHDFIAALYVRDGVERGLAMLSDEAVHIAAVDVADELLRSFTALDVDGLLQRFQPDLPTQPWWWKRVPALGPVAEELQAAPPS